MHSILVAEDDAITRRLLVQSLKRDGFRPVSEAASLHDADHAISMLKPSVVVLDLVLIGGDAMSRLGGWIAANPAMRIIVLSAHDDDVTLYRLHALGVTCHIPKRAAEYRVVVDSIRASLRGETIITRHMTSAVRRIRRECFSLFTQREQDLLEALGMGSDDEHVAQVFGFSINTARTHRANIMRKLGLNSRTELMHWAFRQGFTRRRIALASITPAGSPDWPERAA